MEREAPLSKCKVPLWGFLLLCDAVAFHEMFDIVCIVSSCLACLVLSILSSPFNNGRTSPPHNKNVGKYQSAQYKRPDTWRDIMLSLKIQNRSLSK